MKELIFLGAIGIGGYFLIKNIGSNNNDYDMRTAQEIKQNRIAALSQPVSTSPKSRASFAQPNLTPSTSGQTQNKPQPRKNQIYGITNIWGFQQKT